MDDGYRRTGDAMKTSADTKLTTVQFEYDAEKTEALRFYLGDRGSSLQQELSEAMDVIFKKNVPAQVREYINRNNSSITKPVKSE